MASGALACGGVGDFATKAEAAFGQETEAD
jgi:hypothetical protein